MINIENAPDYTGAQKKLIQKSAQALSSGGHLYLDFALWKNPKAVFSSLTERSYFSETDDFGTSGRTVSYGGAYDTITQICADAGHTELITYNGGRIIQKRRIYKHIPTLQQVYSWIAEAGLTVKQTYHNFTKEPIPTPLDESTFRATIWGGKE